MRGTWVTQKRLSEKLHSAPIPSNPQKGSLDYRPQRSCGQGNIFTPVCHSVHRGGMSEAAPPGPDTPRAGTPQQVHHHLPDQTPRAGTPPGGPDTPPQDQTPPGRYTTSPPLWEADASIRSMSSRYASYWNAFLFNYKTERKRKLLALSSQTPFYPNKTWAKHAIWEEQIGFAQEGGLLCPGLLCPPNENRCLIFQ